MIMVMSLKFEFDGIFLLQTLSFPFDTIRKKMQVSFKHALGFNVWARKDLPCAV